MSIVLGWYAVTERFVRLVDCRDPSEPRYHLDRNPLEVRLHNQEVQIPQ